MSTTAPNNKNGAHGEKAAQEVKGGLRGLNSLAEGIRKNINTFADDLIGNKKTHESTGFSSDAKLAGKEVEDTISGEGRSTTTTAHPTATTDAAAPVPATDATGAHGVSGSTTEGHAPAPAAAPVVSGSTPDSHATGQPVVSK